MRRLTMLEGFRSTVRRYPDAAALRTLDGRSVTYRRFDERTDALAAALEDRLGDGRCAALSTNRIAPVEAMYAAFKRGRANVQLSTRGAVGELVSMIETGAATGLIYDDETAGRVTEIVERVDLDLVVGIGDAADAVPGAVAYEDMLADASADAAPDEPGTDPPEAGVFFTSGTTSEPKAVLEDQTQYWLAANQPALEMSLDAGDRALVCTPWYHGVTAMAWLAAHVTVGATAVLQRTFEPEETLRAIEAHEITGLLAVPTQLEALLDAQDEVEADADSLTYIRTGGAVVPDTLIRRVRERLADGVFNTYGQTEAVVNLSFAYPAEQDDHPGTIGKGTFTWNLRVVEAVDPDDRPEPSAEVGPGGTGEILAQGPRMIDGYIGRPEESEGVFVEDATGEQWLRTGDVARVDSDGYLVVVDRVDNMIVSGGENVYPEAVQRALKDHPGVRDAGVVGLPDEEWGQVVAAAVVVREGVDEGALDAHCRAHDTLADFKRPRRYVLLSGEETLPRTATGTLRRREVEAMFEDG